jgi:hypothetical protein
MRNYNPRIVESGPKYIHGWELPKSTLSRNSMMEGNPTFVRDSWGNVITPSNHNRMGEHDSYIITIDSRERDVAKFANANNFQVWLPRAFKNVYSIELLEATIPIPAAIVDRFVALRIDEAPIIEQAHGAGYTDITPTSVDTSQKTISGGGSVVNTWARDSMAVIPLSSDIAVPGGVGTFTRPATWFRRTERRVIKRFYPVKGKIERLHISLNQHGTAIGAVTAYPFGDEVVGNLDPGMLLSSHALSFSKLTPFLIDENWEMTIEIVAQA